MVKGVKQRYNPDIEIEGILFAMDTNRYNNSYYVLEAKLVVKNNIVISIATEFVENTGVEEKKPDCELKACYRLMEKRKTERQHTTVIM